MLKIFPHWLRRLVENERIRNSTLDAIPYWAAAAITALVAVMYAKLFTSLEKRALRIYESNPYWFFILAPVGFLVAWWFVHKYSRAAAGSGIPQLMVAAEAASKDKEKASRLLSFRSILVKIISSSVALIGGGAIGREGPTLQIAGAIFYQIGKRLPSFWPKPNLQSLTLAGGAAGLAAAFNTPLGGIVYVIEEVTKTHLSLFRTPILHAVLVAGLVSQLILGPYLFLGYPQVGKFSAEHIPSVIVIGLLIGTIGSFFGRLLFRAVLFKDRLRSTRSVALLAVICGLLFATLVVLVGPSSLGSGKHVINELLFNDPKAAEWTWPLARMTGNFLTIAAGSAGGIFAPALASGAAIGSKLVVVFPDLNAKLVVLLGMIAFLTGVTHSPLTAFVLVLEMSDRRSAIFPMMITALAAYAGAVLIDRKSFYEHMKARFERTL